MLNTDYGIGEVRSLASQIENESDKVGFKNVFENSNGGVSILFFRAGQSLAEHLAPAEAMVYVMDGEVRFTVEGKLRVLKSGDFMLMCEGTPHSVVAKSDAKVMLVKIKP